MKESTRSQWANHFAILREAQTWKNMAYLLMAFPLGLAYFIISVVGLSTGVGLLIIWIGLFILMALFATWWGLAHFERLLAIHLLGQDIAPMSSPYDQPEGIAERVMAHFSNPVTWKSAGFLFLKFPLGLALFVVSVTLLSTIGGLVFAPFLYRSGEISILFWEINSFFDAILASGVGLFLAPLAFKVLNGLALYAGKFASLMLGSADLPKEKSPEDILKTA